MKVKHEHPDCIVMFRMGDFYEMFYEDAKTASRELNITLTARGKDEKRAPLAGIPFHSIDPYIAKLVKKGYKIAICEQMEDPKKAKGLVKRDLVRIITPGTVVEDTILNERANNYLMSISKEGDKIGIALADISTGEFMTTQLIGVSRLYNEVTKFAPAEVIVPTSLEESDMAKSISDRGVSVHTHDDIHFWHKSAYSLLTGHFGTINLEGFGCEQMPLAISAAGALLSYVKETQRRQLDYMNKLSTFSTEDFMVLDSSTQRNLELIKNIRDNSSRGSLLSVLDETKTSMGSRMLRNWIVRPLLDTQRINERLDCIDELADNTILRQRLREILGNVADVERLISRIVFGSGNARDMISLKNSLDNIPLIRTACDDAKSHLLIAIRNMPDVRQVTDIIERGIRDDPAATLREGRIIKAGFDPELDSLRSISKDGKSWILEMEEKEKQRTGIKSLRIRYNKVFGYFIEVTRSNLSMVPEHYIRKQTQSNSERFMTPELKEMEDKVLGAEERIVAMEYELYCRIATSIAQYTKDIQTVAHNIAKLDVLCSLAQVASVNGYCKPQVDSNFDLAIKDSRHPVVEKLDESMFVPNDCALDQNQKMIIITGPNMAGKSTYMRQVALIVLMAQIGSFVPASFARIGIVDRIFTRVGAYDDLTMGQSTFMVEMSETANILNNATSRSLIILDEIGRGTSTYDGISIAWAVAEHIHNQISAKTLFATHYHQMNRLSETYPAIRNYNIAIHEKDDGIVFLRKIVEGGTDRSYGIQVANLAGLPGNVIDRAKVIMNRLEMEDEIGERIHKDLKARYIEEKTDKPAPGRHDQKVREAQQTLLGL